MKHNLTILTLLISAICVCVGCHSKSAATANESATVEAAAAPAEPVTVEEVTTEPLVQEPQSQEQPAPQQQNPRRRMGLYGEWLVKSEFNGRPMESILTFSRNAEGALTSQSIGFRGITELSDVTFQDGKLSYTQTFQGRDGQNWTSTFAGTMEDGTLSGTVSSDRGDIQLTGERIRPMSRAVGTWTIKMTIGEREITSTLVITADDEGELSGQWQSQRGEHQITDLAYQRRTLTFKRHTKMQDNEWDSTFEGTIQGNTLTGTFTSDRGEIAVEGQRVGADLIGNWDLELTSDRGTRQQRLKVNPDLSGLYGAMPIEKINLDDDQVSFKIALQFGDRDFEMSFAGTLEDSKLVGTFTTSRGTQTVTGTKIVRPSFRGRRPGS